MSTKGKVVYFDDVKGIGLIDDGESARNFKVSYKDVKASGLRSLSVGDRVEFEKRDDQAVEVSVTQKAEDLPMLAKVLDVTMSDVPRRIKDTIIEGLHEDEKKFTKYVLSNDRVSVTKALADLKLSSKSQFRKLDHQVADTLRSNLEGFTKAGRSSAIY